MDIITRVDMDRTFSEKVNEMINKGYVISTSTMSGSQGEIAKVDLTDGTDTYRVLMEDGNFEEFDDYVETITIRIIKYNGCTNGTRTLWNSQGETIYRKNYYEIGNHSGKYIEDIVTIKEILKIRKGRTWRWERRTDMTSHRNIRVTPEIIKKLYRMVKTTRGYSGIRKCDIEGIRRCGVEYIIFMNDNATRARWTKRITLTK